MNVLCLPPLQSGKPASRTGISQGDCALSTEMNLALALEHYSSVSSVDFETVWGEGHTQAEREGNAAENFILWVESCTR